MIAASADARERFEREGYVLYPEFLGTEETRRLDRLCRRIERGFRRRNEGADWIRRTTNLSAITDPAYVEDPEELLPLLELFADERVLSRLEEVGGRDVRFHNSQYFFEQPEAEWDGPWHRDTQFDAAGDEDEKVRMSSFTGVHFRVALQNDPWLEIVPGSHRRWDTPEEREIRRLGSDATIAMPRARPLPLARGDALLFHAWSIHRGRYRKAPRRSTLDLVYGWPGPCPFMEAPRQPPLDEAILGRLSPRARRFLFSEQTA